MMAKTASKPKPLSDADREAYRGIQDICAQALADAAAQPVDAAAGGALTAAALQIVDAPGEQSAAVMGAPLLIPLSRLKLAKKNVRRGGEAELEQLAADIQAHGVLQNLVGTWAEPDGEASSDACDVLIVAGGRRLRALQLLKRRGDIGDDRLVPVQIVPGDAAREASLAENFQRLAMGAGEEAEAFGRLAEDEKLDAAAIAARFGLSVLHVKQRLRLAALAPAVLAALKERKITLEVAQAFASVPNVARQDAVWKLVRGDRYALGSPNDIRRRMADQAVRPDVLEARYVGEAAYLAAGGPVEVDLFAQGEAALWLDGGLVNLLAREKLAAEAETIRVNDGWGRVIPYLYWSEGSDLRRDLIAYEGGEDIADIPADIRSGLVLLITLESDGADGWAIEMDELYLLDASVKVETPAADADAAGADDGDADDTDDGETPPATEPEEEGLKPLPGGLVDELRMRRRDQLALSLTHDPERARDLTMFLLIEQAGKRFSHDSSVGSCLKASANDLAEPITRPPEGYSWEHDVLAGALQAAWKREGVDDSWRHLKSVADRFAAFIELPVEERLAWNAVAVGQTLTAWGSGGAALSPGRSHPALHDAVAASIGLTTHKHWFPTAANYFDRAGKARCLQMLEQVFERAEAKKPGGELLAVTAWAKWKKAELASACAALAKGDSSKLGGLGGADTAAIEAAGRAWVPAEISFGKVGA